jgi:hypothetical protein
MRTKKHFLAAARNPSGPSRGGWIGKAAYPVPVRRISLRNSDDSVTWMPLAEVQSRPGIFYHTEEQRRLALKSKEALGKTKPFKEPIVTEVTQAGEFYPAAAVTGGSRSCGEMRPGIKRSFGSVQPRG